MRYKTFMFKMVRDEYEKGSLSDIEIYANVSSECEPEHTAHMYECIPETHPAFNTDIWCNIIDQIEVGNYLRFAFGGDEVINFLKYNFLHVIEYYSNQI